MAIKLRTIIKFPAQVLASTGLGVSIANRRYTFFQKWSAWTQSLATPDTSITEFPFLQRGPLGDGTDDVYGTISLALLLTLLTGGVRRIVTAAGTVIVATNDAVVAINKSVGAATTVTMPLASTKVGDVLIADLKRDAGTNNITINATAPDTIQGLSSYTIAANGGSVYLRIITGGYVI